MEYLDLTQAAQETLQASAPATREHYDHDQAHRLRRRMLGVLIRRSRLAAELPLEGCAEALHVEAEELGAWELGARAPSLPQLERLAAYIGSGGAETGAMRDGAADEYFELRRRIIGALLQLSRRAQERSREELSASTGLEEETLLRYEYGEASVPVHHLTLLAQALGQDLSYFTDSLSIARALSGANAAEPPAAPAGDAELKAFAAEAKNQAFIRLAMAFRDIDGDDLRRIADALCVIIKQRREANGRSR